MSAMAATRRLLANQVVVAAELNEEAVLLNVETGIYFGLDTVGAFIWPLLAEGTTEVAIVDRVLDAFDAEAVQVRSDVASFVDALIAKGLVCRVDG